MLAVWSRLRVIVMAAAIAVAGVASCSAQTTGIEDSTWSAKLHEGDAVFVTTRTEGEIRGRFVRATPAAIVVTAQPGERTIALRDVGWIEKRGDSLWNGALIGGAIWGFGMMGGAGASCSPDCASQVAAATAIGIAMGAAAGALIDRLAAGRTLVYGTRFERRREDAREPHPAPHDRSPLASLWTQVAPGARITVGTTNGAEIEGRFARASDSSLALVDGSVLREIPADEVSTVRRHSGGTHAKKGLLIGIPLGALSGSRPCYRVDDASASPSGPGISCGAGVLLGAAAGGAVGALIGGHTWGSTLVYSVAPIASNRSVGVVGSLSF